MLVALWAALLFNIIVGERLASDLNLGAVNERQHIQLVKPAISMRFARQTPFDTSKRPGLFS